MLEDFIEIALCDTRHNPKDRFWIYFFHMFCYYVECDFFLHQTFGNYELLMNTIQNKLCFALKHKCTLDPQKVFLKIFHNIIHHHDHKCPSKYLVMSDELNERFLTILENFKSSRFCNRGTIR